MYYCIYKYSPFNYWIVELLNFIYRIMKHIYSIWKKWVNWNLLKNERQMIYLQTSEF